ncbi:MAG: TolC family protein [Deltaproteobacteria bacterium]|nr:TolC family protein [Deltaproteobacteria bacterium]
MRATRRALLPTLATLVGLLGLLGPASAFAFAGADEIGDLPAGATISADHTLRLDLDAAIKLALRRSPLLPAAAAGVDGVRAKLAEAKAAMLPSFEATGFFSVMPTKRAGTSGADWINDWDWSELRPLATVQLTFTQVLTTFGKLTVLEQMAHVGLRIAEALREVAIGELRYQLAQAWWGLVMAADLDDLARQGRSKMEAERERLETMRDDGEEGYDPADMVRLLELEAEFEEKVRAAERARDLAQDALRLSLALPPHWQIEPDRRVLEAIEYTLLPITAYESLAVANHPRELSRRGGVQVKWEALRYERFKLLPDLVITGRLATTYAPGLQQTNDSLADNPTNPTQSGAGVALRWRLDVFRQFAKIDQAEAAYRYSREQAKIEMQKTRAAIRNLWREVRDRQAVLALQAKAMRATRGQLAQAADLADKGLGSRAAAQRALERYVRRHIAYAEHVYRYNVGIAELSRAVGTDVRAMQPAPAKAP